jgi:hypothetical protein
VTEEGGGGRDAVVSKVLRDARTRVCRPKFPARSSSSSSSCTMAHDPTTPTPKPRKRKTPAAPADTLVASSSKPPAPKKRRKDKGKDGVAPADVVIAAAAAADKGKARASEFRTVRAAVPLSLPPVYAMDARAGACEMLDSLVMQYVYIPRRPPDH